MKKNKRGKPLACGAIIDGELYRIIAHYLSQGIRCSNKLIQCELSKLFLKRNMTEAAQSIEKKIDGEVCYGATWCKRFRRRHKLPNPLIPVDANQYRHLKIDDGEDFPLLPQIPFYMNNASLEINEQKLNKNYQHMYALSEFVQQYPMYEVLVGPSREGRPLDELESQFEAIMLQKCHIYPNLLLKYLIAVPNDEDKLFNAVAASVLSAIQDPSLYEKKQYMMCKDISMLKSYVFDFKGNTDCLAEKIASQMDISLHVWSESVKMWSNYNPSDRYDGTRLEVFVFLTVERCYGVLCCENVM